MAYDPIVPRARLGFIIPSSNRMVEPQVTKFAPQGVVPHFARARITTPHEAPLEQQLPRILEAAMMLNDSKCDVTVLQCTGTSMSGGVDMEKHVIREIEKATGRPALSAASSLTSAFRSVGARKLVFISETKQPGHDRKLRFLREAGYEIVADKAVGLSGTDEYCVTPPQLWYDTAIALRRDEADAYFISCANIAAIDVIEAVEAVVKKPVITSNQAALWCALKTVGLNEVVPGLGRLMTFPLRKEAAAAE